MHRTADIAARIASGLALLLGAVLLIAAMTITPGRVLAASVAVDISGNEFVPPGLNLSVGDSVTWTNRDAVPHTATTTSGPASFNSGILATDQAFSYTFTVAGTYAYFCAVHPEMTASVTVTGASTPTPVPTPTRAPTGSAPPLASQTPGGVVAPDTAMAPGSIGLSGGLTLAGFIFLAIGLAGLSRQLLRSRVA